MSKSFPQMQPESGTGIPASDPSYTSPSAPPSYAQATGHSAPGWVFSQQPTAGAGPPPQAGYPGTQYGNVGASVPPAASYHTQTGASPVVIIQQPVVLPLGPDPALITCPFCHAQKMTRIEYAPNSCTHLTAALLCILGFWCCVCLPYCVGSCMNANHYCSNCNQFLGVYSHQSNPYR